MDAGCFRFGYHVLISGFYDDDNVLDAFSAGLNSQRKYLSTN
jgi:hypothetical protein